MTKFNSIRQPFPAPHHLPDGRVMHESGVTLKRETPPKDDDDQTPEPPHQRPVLFFFRGGRGTSY
jgi:hypothetical protein